MDEERIVVKAARKKVLSKLAPVLGELGFSRVDYSKDKLVVEKSYGEDLSGKKQLHYKIIFGNKSIEFVYSIPPGANRRARMMEVFPVLLNTIRIAEGHYDVSPSSLFEPVAELLGEVGKVVGKDIVDISSELDSVGERHSTLSKKYEDLVRSSEENARILLECERKRDELQKRIDELEAMSDETLKEELFRWLKVRSGNIDLLEFSKAHNVSYKRIEEGLNLMIKEGHIKKKAV